MSESGEGSKAGPEETQGSQAPQGPTPPAGGVSPAEADANLPARLGEERLSEPVIRSGMFGVQDTPDTSGFGLLRVHEPPPLDSPRPYGSYFDEIADTLGLPDAIERVVVDRGELTFHVRRERLPEVACPACTTRARPGANCTRCTTCSRSRTTAGCGSR